MEALRAGRRDAASSCAGCPTAATSRTRSSPGPTVASTSARGRPATACVESDPRSAAILSFRADGSDLRVVATGLRNPYGLVFADGSLYATVNGRDDLGKNEPAEMVVRIRPRRRLRLARAAGPATRSRRLIGGVQGRRRSSRVPRAALVGRRDRLVARRSLRRRMGRVPLTRARPTSRAHPRWTRDDLRHRLRSSARARRQPQPRPARRGLGPGRDLLDR